MCVRGVLGDGVRWERGVGWEGEEDGSGGRGGWVWRGMGREGEGDGSGGRGGWVGRERGMVRGRGG